jgi:hypothetical protein
LEVTPGRYGESTIARFRPGKGFCCGAERAWNGRPGGVYRVNAVPQATVTKPSSGAQDRSAGRGHPLQHIEAKQGSTMTSTHNRTMPGIVGYLSILVIFVSVIGPALL